VPSRGGDGSGGNGERAPICSFGETVLTIDKRPEGVGTKRGDVESAKKKITGREALSALECAEKFTVGRREKSGAQGKTLLWHF